MNLIIEEIMGVNATNYYILHHLNIYWINMINDIKLYIKKCLTCIKIKNNKKNTKIISKTILSKGPKDRYVIDLWYYPPELNSSNSNYAYILDIIEHFSKYTETYLLNTKESMEIFPYFKNFIKIHGIPKYFFTDNGKSSKINYLKISVIIMILNLYKDYLIGHIRKE